MTDLDSDLSPADLALLLAAARGPVPAVVARLRADPVRMPGSRLRHRRLGYTVTAHARPYGLLLLDDAGSTLRNWTFRAGRDEAELAREWEMAE